MFEFLTYRFIKYAYFRNMSLQPVLLYQQKNRFFVLSVLTCHAGLYFKGGLFYYVLFCQEKGMTMRLVPLTQINNIIFVVCILLKFGHYVNSKRRK